jgi:modulator of FtsH protease HflK
MERSIQKNGLINLLALLAAAAATLALARTGQALAANLAAGFMGLGTLVAIVSWFQMRLEERERAEKLEFDELARSKGGSSLFETQDAGNFPAQQSRAQFEKWFVPAFTILLLILQAAGAWVAWRWLAKPTTLVPLKQPMVTAAFSAVTFLVLFLIGRFAGTVARLENLRLLRPGSSYLLLSSFVSLVAAASIGLVKVIPLPLADLIIAKALTVLLGVLAVETLVSLILEIYRPRVKGKVTRPVYESRLVGLLAHPEDVFTTAAHTFDYQFGFKVSDTWIFKFFEKALGWLLLLQFIVLMLSTCVVFIEPGERGLLERWGKPVAGRSELSPGPHLKWPYPIDQVYRFRTELVQVFTIGSQVDPDKARSPVVLWTVPHTKEELLLVGNKDRVSIDTANKAAGKSTPPVSLLTVSFPVQYNISDVKAYAYNHENSGQLLEDIATREVLRYLAGSDINDVMARGRQESAELLRKDIQDAVSAVQPSLGVTVKYIGLQDIHPPVKVAPDFEKVIGAAQEKQAKILAAQAEAVRTNALAGAEAFKLVADAEASRQRAEVNVGARAGLFTNQIPAFKAAPSVYVERAYLQMFAKATAPARKYVIATTNTDDVIQFDLQDKISRDMVDVTVPTKQ